MRLQLAALLLPTLASCSVFGGNSALNAHGGLRDLSSDIDTVEDQAVFGLEGTLGLSEHWGVEGSVWIASEEGRATGGLTPELETEEYALGLRRTFLPDSPVKLYAGAGANWIDAELSGLGAGSESDDGIGAYAHVGVTAAILMFNAGLDLRGALTGAELAGEDLNYLQATVFVGFTF
jgi:hypothetical protein